MKKDPMIKMDHGEKKMITCICGPMFSGKTEELLRLFVRHRIAGHACVLIRPEQDVRHKVDPMFQESRVCSRSGASEDCFVLGENDDLSSLETYTHLFVDEAWMLSQERLESLIRLEKPLYCTVLNAFYDGTAIQTTSFLLALAGDIKFLTNICSFCGAEGSRSFKQSGGQKFEVGNEAYKAACFKCWSRMGSLPFLTPMREPQTIMDKLA